MLSLCRFSVLEPRIEKFESPQKDGLVVECRWYPHLKGPNVTYNLRHIPNPAIVQDCKCTRNLRKAFSFASGDSEAVKLRLTAILYDTVS